MTAEAVEKMNPPADPWREIRVLSLSTVRGANFWSHEPVARMQVAVGKYEDISSADVPWTTDLLVNALPGLIEHRCSTGKRGGFIRRLRDGTYAAHIAEHIALELMTMIGHDLGFGRTRGTGTRGEYTIVVEYMHEAVGRRAIELGLQTVQHAFAGDLHDVNAAVEELRVLASTPDVPPISNRIVCGVVGCRGREEARTALIERLKIDDSDLMTMSFSQMLETGLPYDRSDIAVVLDADPEDVPTRYRDPERAARLAAVVADGLSRGGIVVCAADLPHVHDEIREARRSVRTFQPDRDPRTHAENAARVAASALKKS